MTANDTLLSPIICLLCHPNLAILIFVNLAASVMTSKLPTSLPLLSFIPNLTTVTHFVTTYLPKTVFNIIQNSLARRPTVVKSSKFSHITPVLKSLHWLKIDLSERIEYIINSFTFKVLTTSPHAYLSSQPDQSFGPSKHSLLVCHYQHFPLSSYKSLFLLCCTILLKSASYIISPA